MGSLLLPLRRFDSIAIRLSLIATLSGVPLAGLAVTVLVQNYRDAQFLETRHLSEGVEAVSGQARLALADSAGTLRGLAAMPGVALGDPISCAAGLAAGLKVLGGGFHDVAVLDGNGAWRCGTGRRGDGNAGSGLRLADPPDPEAPLVLTVADAGVVLRGVLPAARLLAAAPDGGGMARGAGRTSCWVADGVEVAPLCGGAGPGLPSPSMLARLMRPEMVVTVRRPGSDYLYTSVPLGDSVRLVVGSDVAAEHSAARRVLLVRAAWLGLLMLAGLYGLVLGVRRAVVEPLRLLGLAVGAWRSTGRFVAPSATLPLEVGALCDSFGRATATLSQREAELSRAVEQQKLAMQEIHHRVKNNLQTVAALLRLQARRTTNEEARSALAESVRRVSSIALVHDTLSMSADEKVDLDDVVDRLVPMMTDVATLNSQVTVRREGRLGVMAAELATPLVMVLTELVQNALEHGFPPGGTGSVVIRAERSARALDVVVHDDGRGLPEDFTLDRVDRLGLQIVRTLVDAELRGTLELRAAEGGGTDAVLGVPLGRRSR